MKTRPLQIITIIFFIAMLTGFVAYKSNLFVNKTAPKITEGNDSIPSPNFGPIEYEQRVEIPTNLDTIKDSALIKEINRLNMTISSSKSTIAIDQSRQRLDSLIDAFRKSKIEYIRESAYPESKVQQ